MGEVRVEIKGGKKRRQMTEKRLAALAWRCVQPEPGQRKGGKNQVRKGRRADAFFTHTRRMTGNSAKKNKHGRHNAKKGPDRSGMISEEHPMDTPLDGGKLTEPEGEARVI